MTQYPECYLARELEICYVNISLITDYDVGLEGQDGIAPVSHEEVIKVFTSNNERVKGAIFEIIKATPAERTCSCGTALTGARF
jgi:5'-methylthioadenosine phosphorylase